MNQNNYKMRLQASDSILPYNLKIYPHSFYYEVLIIHLITSKRTFEID